MERFILFLFLVFTYSLLFSSCGYDAKFETDNATNTLVEHEGFTCKMVSREYYCGEKNSHRVILNVKEVK